ncbi:Receptor-like serine/threonine-protein kinase [Nymphaea thermarum]|nr:Receptor-like serine/threonine-protein kinase [Nymphaea thermarum]
MVILRLDLLFVAIGFSVLSFGLLVHGNVLLPVHLPPVASPRKQIAVGDPSVNHGRGYNFGHAHPPSGSASRHLPPRAASPPQAGVPKPAYGPSHPTHTWIHRHSHRPVHSHSLPPSHPGPVISPSGAPSKSHNDTAVAPSPEASSPKASEGCEQNGCVDPLTSTPIGSPCGCVLPIRVKLKLGVASYAVFPLIAELEIDVAGGTYLKQSQVRIMGADADNQDQEKTVVNIDLVPLGEKFDNATALLIYERFWQKKVAINASHFGDYEVVYVHYPGLPPSPPLSPGGGSTSGTEQPFVAKVISRNVKMNGRTVAVIVLSSVVAFLVCSGAFWILLLKCKKYRRASSADGAAFTSSIIKRSGIRSLLSSSMGSSMSMSLVSSVAPCMLSVKTFSLVELDRATDGFSYEKVLGEGGFGRVYHGVLDDGTEVAVKVLTKDNQNGDREFISEVEMLSRLHHRNLVKLIGICIEEHNRCLVYELIPNGSVESHLHGPDKQNAPLDWDARMKVALGAARGLAYLHEDSNPRVIHRDFKASNVLLENDFTPKVSDFGLAREASDGSQHISTRVMGTFGYVAPEYAMTGHLLVKSDVYSYGVVLLELLSGRKPVDMSKPPGQENLVTWARPLLTSQEGLERLVDPSLSGKYNFDNMARVAAIASMCVHPEVSQRPFMGEVVQALKLVYNDADEACEDCQSHREDSSGPECDFRPGFTPENSWWQRERPGYEYGSSFITTMEYSSDPLDGIERPHSTLTFAGGRILDLRGSPSRWQNRSCPVIHSKPSFYRLRGSMSEHGFFAMREPHGYGQPSVLNCM